MSNYYIYIRLRHFSTSGGKLRWKPYLKYKPGRENSSDDDGQTDSSGDGDCSDEGSMDKTEDGQSDDEEDGSDDKTIRSGESHFH